MKKRVNPSFYTLCRTAFNLTRGYQKLHAMGAKYQDISFGNLFFNPDNGDVLICDNDNVSFDNSKPGGVLGTPGFMAPEIVRGENDHPKIQTDIHFPCYCSIFYGKSSTGRKAGSKYPLHGYGSQSEVVWHRSGIYL